MLGDALPDGEPGSVQRRAPFSVNPTVGVRGQRAQQRILEAALQVFGDVGYHRCGVARITEVAGCSRAAFYQYFSSREDVFRHLAGQVARQLAASAEALDPITPDAAGWRTLRRWVGRHLDIYRRYEPVFRVFESAAESDEVVAAGAARVGERHVAGVQAKLTTTSLPNRRLGEVVGLLISTVTRMRRQTDILRQLLPAPGAQRPGAEGAKSGDAASFDLSAALAAEKATVTDPRTLLAPSDERVDVALTDVVHRTLFGLDPTVNVHGPPADERSPTGAEARAHGAALLESLHAGAAPKDFTPAGARTLDLLLKAGHDVLVTRGYERTRVDDITDVAEVSHGAFYRYFENKEHIVRLLGLQALQETSARFDEIAGLAREPGPAGSTALRHWLRRYSATHATHVAMIRVWLDATADDPKLGRESAAAMDWGRRRLVRFLTPRGFGDVDCDALMAVGLVELIAAGGNGGGGGDNDGKAAIEAGALVIERGLLGLDATRRAGDGTTD